MRSVLIFAPSFAPAINAGGPARALTNLVRELDGRYEITVVTSARDLGSEHPFPGLAGRKVTLGATTIYYVDLASARQRNSIVGVLTRHRYDLAILNSVWHTKLSLWPAFLAMVGLVRAKETVLMPRGELEPGALRLKGRKKRVASPFVRAVYGRVVTMTAATSASEQRALQTWFPDKPAELTVDAVDQLPVGYQPRGQGPLRLLFLGRVHPTKGLRPLITALRHAEGDIHLRVVGPIVDDLYWRACREDLRCLADSVVVTYEGVAPRERIADLFRSSDAMVSLTAGENFGHTIAESLQVGCPVIVTDTTPWTRSIFEGGGSIIADRADEFEVSKIVSEWAAMGPSELNRRRELAREAFDDWQRSACPNVVDLVFGVTTGGGASA